MLCAISGNSPVTPVVNKNSGNVYEKSLILKYIRYVFLYSPPAWSGLASDTHLVYSVTMRARTLSLAKQSQKKIFSK